MDKKEFIEELITTIEEEFEIPGCSTEYECKEGNIISTDVGYVYEWFNEYKEVLRKRYS